MKCDWRSQAKVLTGGGDLREASRKFPPPVNTLAWLGLAWLLQSHFIAPAYEDGTDRVFRNVGIYNSDAGELPERKHNETQVALKSDKNKGYFT